MAESNLKLQHWRGFQAIYAPEAPPVLEFEFLFPVSRRRSPSVKLAAKGNRHWPRLAFLC
jgi:hypothetical protein